MTNSPHDRRSRKFKYMSALAHALNKLRIIDQRASFGPPALIKLIRSTSFTPKWKSGDEILEIYTQKISFSCRRRTIIPLHLKICIKKNRKNRHLTACKHEFQKTINKIQAKLHKQISRLNFQVSDKRTERKIDRLRLWEVWVKSTFFQEPLPPLTVTLSSFLFTGKHFWKQCQ